MRRLSPPNLQLRSEASHAGVSRRHLQVGAIVVFVAVLAWAGAATWMLFFRDAVVAGLIVRQQRITLAYEDQLAALRRQLDLVASRQYLEQERVEARVAQVLERQEELERRQSLVDALQRQASGIEAVGRPAGGIAAPVAAGTTRPSPPANRPSRGEAARDRLGALRYLPAPQRLARTDQALERLTHRQTSALSGMLASSQRRLDRYVDIVASVGLPTGPLTRLPGKAAGGVGGPYVPVQADAPMHFGSLADTLKGSLTLAARAAGVVAALPLGRPAETEETSPFGVRLDPFLRAPALHTGLDFRASYGAPVRATGPGTVVFAGYSGGYGNMVEIEHVSGVTTRYAHLSGFAVTEGDTIAAGDVVGRAGSTGRSTGPHIHYETRIGGDPVDPQRFIAAGARLYGRR
ncbi:M23 family metallopeptidase [Chelatococcus sp. CO-6]|uniref:M23 family metallopeptidase n=2 Tax=unclassified Chelatococcus TaxID=2638111 RepID=UPI00069FF1ED|nr:M23 family metallopeptidase [Chelatococcus sp. CO-6]